MSSIRNFFNIPKREDIEAKYERGDWQGIINDTDKTNEAWALRYRGDAKRLLSDYQGAITDLNACLAKEPGNAWALSSRGGAKLMLGDYQGALTDLNAALAKQPSSAFALKNRGAIKRALGNYQGAITDLNASLAIEPSNALALSHRGAAKRLLGDYQGAIIDLDAVLAKEPDDAWALSDRGEAKLMLGDYQGAITDWDAVLVKWPGDAWALSSRGEAKRQLCDYQGAIIDLDACLAKEPDNAFALSARGKAKRQLGDYQGAITDLDACLAKEPDNAGALRARGEVKQLLGDLEGAITDLDACLAKGPGDAFTLRSRGVVKLALGDYKGAIIDLGACLAKEPYDGLALQGHIEAKQQLEHQEKLKVSLAIPTPSIPAEDEKKVATISRPASISQWPVSFEIPYSELTLGKELGRGGYGIVYQGTWRYNQAAIKKLLNQNITPKTLEELQSESQIMVRLRSPNIVQFYGACLMKPNYCLVMECMPKGSLFNVLHSHEALSWETRYRIVRDMAAGLAFLHAENIIHRDLKSLNVLLDEQYRAKLTDFGLAKVKTESQSTSTKSSAGTLAWMAPELFKRQATCTKQSDIYSLGITFWEVSSRKLPFADASNQALIQNWISQGERDEISADCPPKLAKLVKWCWDQEPAKRPSAVQVLDYITSDAEELQSTSAAMASGPVYRFNSN